MVRYRLPGIIALFACLLPFYDLAAAAHTNGLVISELYRDPPGGEGEVGGGKTHEFVELFNCSSDTFQVAGLFVTNGAGADSIVAVDDTVPGGERCTYGASTIVPGAVALILDRDYCLLPAGAAVSRFSLPEGTVLLTISDTAFGSAGLAAQHGVALYRGRKNHIDTLYDVAADTPFVLETPTSGLLHLTDPPNIEGYSLSAKSFTSGFLQYDYTADSINPGRVAALRGAWLLEPEFGQPSADRSTVICTLQMQSFRNESEVRLHITGGGRTVTSITVPVIDRQATGTAVLPVDGTALQVSIEGCPECIWPLDVSSAVTPAQAAHVSELFPRGTAYEPEWVELYNSSSAAVNLKNWSIATPEDTTVVTPVSLQLAPHAYLVLTKNAAVLAQRYPSLDNIVQPQSWASLYNSRDTVFLLDSRNHLVETVCYDADVIGEWPAVSIERSDFSQGCGVNVWTVPERSTPGMPPQSRNAAPGTSPHLEIGPVPFTPDNDRRDDLLAVTLTLPPGAAADITIYGFDGTPLASFQKRVTSVVYWDGRSGGRGAPAGPFFVCAEVTSGTKKTVLRKKGILWRR